MTLSTRHLIWLILFLPSMGGCATSWVAAQGRYVSAPQKFEIDLPSGWKRYETKQGLMVTRDGLALESIAIARYPIGNELAFTKKRIVEGMLPQDAAAVIVDDVQSNPNIKNFNMVENVPASVAGHPGFKIVCSYQTDSELSKGSVLYGVVLDKWYYIVSYDAPSRHYFDMHLAAFEGIKNSFQVKR